MTVFIKPFNLPTRQEQHRCSKFAVISFLVSPFLRRPTSVPYATFSPPRHSHFHYYHHGLFISGSKLHICFLLKTHFFSLISKYIDIVTLVLWDVVYEAVLEPEQKVGNFWQRVANFSELGSYNKQQHHGVSRWERQRFAADVWLAA